MRIALPAWKPAVAFATAGALSLALITTAGAQTNSAPTPQNDTAITAEDTAVSIPVLGNDTDPDGDTLSITSVGNADHGTVAISGSSIVYTPEANFHGTDSFNYAVSDGGLLASAVVTVTVTPVNDAPEAKDDSVTVKKNEAKAISVLANDKDVDGDTLTVQAVSAPSHGTAVIGADGKVTYTPATDYVGADSFTYVVTDGTLSDTATVSITVKEKTKTDHDSRVLAACETNAGQPGLTALCGLYQRDDMPFWARWVIGKNILRLAAKTSTSDRVLEACADATTGTPIATLCSLYQDSNTPSWLRSQVGKIILKLDAGVTPFDDRRINDDDDDRRDRKDRDDDDRKRGKSQKDWKKDSDRADSRDRDDDRGRANIAFSDRDSDDDGDDDRGRWNKRDRDEDRRGRDHDGDKRGRGFGFGFAFGRR